MHSFLDAKTMAKALRSALAERRMDITHSDSLELVARQFGLKDWNMLAAHIEAAHAKLAPLPRGWFRTGSGDPSIYWMGPDETEGGVLHIASRAHADLIGDRFASLAQSILADDYRSRMIRLSADLKGIDCASAATIWMRIDGPEDGEWLRFDNLMDRAGVGPLQDTFDWTRREIVLDVPEHATKIVYGLLLGGTGKVWARKITLGLAPPNAQCTDYPRRPSGFGEGVAA